jgi:hypothetical protein
MAEGMAKPRLVSEPAEADGPWLTEVLRHAGVLDDAVVSKVERQRIGTGQIGQNVAFSLTYDRPVPDAPASVVGKFPAPEPEGRAAAKTFRLYEREVRFYQEIASTVDIRIPTCYLADIGEDMSDFVLLFEDLRPAAQGDQVAGCSVDEAMLAMDELAGLHAPRWGDQALANIEWLGQPGDARTAAMIAAAYQGLWPGFVAQYGSSLPSDALALGEKFGASLGAWGRSRTPPYCVVHGDYRLDNMMFGTEEGGYPLATVDWQTVGHGPGILDAAYFIGNGLSVPERRAYEMDLLKRYHNQLIARGVGDYEWKRCLADYKGATLAGVLMAVIASQVVASDERGDAMWVVWAERSFAHALDHDAGATLTPA